MLTLNRGLMFGGFFQKKNWANVLREKKKTKPKQKKLKKILKYKKNPEKNKIQPTKTNHK